MKWRTKLSNYKCIPTLFIATWKFTMISGNILVIQCILVNLDDSVKLSFQRHLNERPF